MTRQKLIFALLFSCSVSVFQAPVSEASDSAFSDFTTGVNAFFELSDKSYMLDLGAAYSYWAPEAIGKADMRTSGLNLFWIEFRSKTLERLGRSLHLGIPKLRYENSLTGNAFSTETKDVIYSSLTADNSYVYFLGMFEFFLPVIFRYETETFISELTAKEDLTYIPFTGESEITLSPQDKLYYETSFHDYSLVYELKGGAVIGGFYSEYQKPYTITIAGEETEPELIFYSVFKSVGIIYEEDMYKKYDKSKNPSFLNVALTFKVGWGEIFLNRDYQLSSELSENEGVAYFNPIIRVGYKKYLGDYFLFSFQGALNYRYFYRYGKNSGDTDATIGETDLNSDLIVKGFAALGILF